MTETLRYIPNNKVPEYLQLGWADLGPISPYSHLMLEQTDELRDVIRDVVVDLSKASWEQSQDARKEGMGTSDCAGSKSDEDRRGC